MNKKVPPRDDDPLAACPERGVGLLLNDPINDRLDVLVDYVEGAGERTTRKELIAALILDAALDANELAACLRRFRLARVVDAVDTSNRRRTATPEAERQPGPRARRPLLPAKRR